MTRKLSQIFKNIEQISPSSQLKERVFESIQVEKDRVIKRELMISRFGLAGSVAVFLVAIFTLGGAILQSEFFNIISLAFSDISVVATHWQEFAYSMAESFPTISVVAILIPVLTALWSLSLYFNFKNKNHFHHYHLIN